MISVDCGSCHKCCQWGKSIRLIPDHPLIRAEENGDCIHLCEKGCTLFNTEDRPDVCERFSCVELVKDMELDPLMRVLMEGIRRTVDDKEEE